MQQFAPDFTMWVHTTNAGSQRPGGVFGWRDSDSPTGLYSGIVVESDHTHLRVRVRDIRPGIIQGGA